MGSHDWDGSYFGGSISPASDRVLSRAGFDDSLDEDLFTISGCNTPMTETAPSTHGVRIDTGIPEHGAGIKTVLTDRSKKDPRVTFAASEHIEHRRPIPSAYAKPRTPALIEPVSARGDPLLDHFSNREKESRREQIYQPHSARRDVNRASQRSSSETETAAAVARKTEARSVASRSTGVGAADALQRGQTAPAAAIADADAPGAAIRPERRGGPTSRSRTAPVVDAYNPTGIPGSAAALGKYYPTNYKASSDASHSPPQGPAGLTTSEQSTFQLSETDQEHKLRQYKRDMISLTLQKAREALSRTLQSPNSTKAAETVLDESTRKSVASGFALLRRYKPLSPRITPLLSPSGPVTPMHLDEHADTDYLTVREARSR